MKTCACFCLAVLFLPLAAARGEDSERRLDVSGQLRTRRVLDDADFNGDTDRTDHSALRARVSVRSDLSERISAFVQVQDSRIYGGEPGTLSATANLDLHQGYIRIDRLLWDGLSFQDGRMELAYGNQRLIGSVGWHNVGRAFDGHVIGLDLRAVHIDLIRTTLREKGARDKEFGGVYLQAKGAPAWLLRPRAFHFYRLSHADNEEIDGKMVRRLGTLGIFGKWGADGGLDVETEIAFQYGEINETTDIAAAMVTGAIGYSFGGARRPRLVLGLDVISGDDPTTDDYEAFNTLFATNHKFYGYMDYFIDIPADTRNLGLTDLMLKGSIHLRRNTTLKVDLHAFGLAQEDPTLEASELGSEVDLTLAHRSGSHISYTAGLSTFDPGDVFKAWHGRDRSSWAYGQITVDF